MHPFLQTEAETIKYMVHIYCGDKHHHSDGLCSQCQNFLDYAYRRIEHCPFDIHKPTCGNCPIHCYKADMGQLARKIMRHAGPKMIFKHPLLALRHLIHNRRKAPSNHNKPGRS